MAQFHETGYGRIFFDHQLPLLIRGIEHLASELEQFNKMVTAVDVIEKIVDKKIDEVLDRGGRK